MDRMKSLLESYYGVGEDNELMERNARDLDSSGFECETYVRELLMDCPLPELLMRDDALISKVKTLDADMQLLVYDNYSKFIDATDTIRKMKYKVEEIETEIEGLVSQIELINTNTISLNDRMSNKRSKMEKLIGLQRLIKKLNFLFELPLRLKQSVEMNAVSQAVNYYKTAAPFLKKYSQVASFAAIEEESLEIINNLKLNLVDTINDTVKEKDYKTLSCDKFNEITALLIELKEPKMSISKLYLEWYRGLLEERLLTFTKMCELAQGDLLPIQQYIDNVNEGCMSCLVEATATFSKLFLTESDNPEAESAVENNQQISEENRLAMKTEMIEFNKFAVTEYLACVRLRFLSETIAVKDDESEDPETCYKPLLTSLKSFIINLRTMQLDPEILNAVKLDDRATEIAEHAIRHQVDIGFNVLRDKVTKHIQVIHAKTNDYNETIAAAAAPAEDEMDTESNIYNNADTKKPLTLLEVTSEISREIQRDIESTMRQLKHLLGAGTSLISEMATMFENLVQFQLHHWFLWLANALECQCNEFHPSLIKDGTFTSGTTGVEELKRSQSVSSEKEVMLRRVSVDMELLQTTPAFLLAIACLCREIEAFVTAASLRIADTPELVKQLKATMVKLLRKYVQVCGEAISKLLRDHLIGTDWVNYDPVSSVSTVSTAVLQQVLQTVKQVNECTSTEDSGNLLIDDTSDNLGGTYNRRYTRGSNLQKDSYSNDIERLFTKKMKIFGPVEFTTDSLIVGILKVVFKTLFEYVRLCTFSMNGYQQLQLDVQFYRSCLPLLVEDSSMLNDMLSQIMISARLRALDHTPLKSNVLDKLINAKREELKTNFR